MRNHFDISQIIKNYSVASVAKAGFFEIVRLIRVLLFGSYSQYGEDMIIEKYLGKKGRYLEIGAYHPKRLSNTYRFYKKGWSGYVVEPNPDIKASFERTRPNDIFYNFGVGKKNGEMKYFKFLIPAINTFSQKEAKKNQAEGHKLDEVIKIKVIGIRELIKMVGQIDYVSLDTEGFDEEILNNWPWAVSRPKVICTEANMKLAGYKLVYKNKFNFIFVLKK